MTDYSFSFSAVQSKHTGMLTKQLANSNNEMLSLQVFFRSQHITNSYIVVAQLLINKYKQLLFSICQPSKIR